ncbi:Protein kinase of the Mitotic Exit Network [Microbotryomycetes sp. JL221]|nr:Protein kinase of the Mitotic Exit Network [Microbotryomycetes sp. JL221]
MSQVAIATADSVDRSRSGPAPFQARPDSKTSRRRTTSFLTSISSRLRSTPTGKRIDGIVAINAATPPQRRQSLLRRHLSSSTYATERDPQMFADPAQQGNDGMQSYVQQTAFARSSPELSKVETYQAWPSPGLETGDTTSSHLRHTRVVSDENVRPIACSADDVIRAQQRSAALAKLIGTAGTRSSSSSPVSHKTNSSILQPCSNNGDYRKPVRPPSSPLGLDINVRGKLLRVKTNNSFGHGSSNSSMGASLNTGSFDSGSERSKSSSQLTIKSTTSSGERATVLNRDLTTPDGAVTPVNSTVDRSRLSLDEIGDRDQVQVGSFESNAPPMPANNYGFYGNHRLAESAVDMLAIVEEDGLVSSSHLSKEIGITGRRRLSRQSTSPPSSISHKHRHSLDAARDVADVARSSSTTRLRMMTTAQDKSTVSQRPLGGVQRSFSASIAELSGHDMTVSSPDVDLYFQDPDSHVKLGRSVVILPSSPRQRWSAGPHRSSNPVEQDWSGSSSSVTPDTSNLQRRPSNRSRHSGPLSSSLSSQGSNVRTKLVLHENGKPSLTYQLGECIGRGQFGSVYRALNLNSGRIVAVKRISLADKTVAEIEQLSSEVQLLKSLSHPSVVNYEGLVKTEHNLNIILEYIENGSLQKTLKAFGDLPEALVASYVVKILEGLDYLHSQHVVHCDLKAANILTTKNGNVKLSDFGVSLNLNAIVSQSMSSSPKVDGTPNWMPPEVIQLRGASTASDIWSLGCTIVELITGKPPYADLNTMSAMFRIVEDECPPIPEACSNELKMFLKSCFKKDPSQRPTAVQLLSHEWLEMNWDPHRDLRPQDSLPFLRRFSEDTPRPSLDEWRSMSVSADPFASTGDVVAERTMVHFDQVNNMPHRTRATSNQPHAFVKTTFSKAIICRLCDQPTKKHSVLCKECGLIAHAKCCFQKDNVPACSADSRFRKILVPTLSASFSEGLFASPPESPTFLASDGDATPKKRSNGGEGVGGATTVSGTEGDKKLLRRLSRSNRPTSPARPVVDKSKTMKLNVTTSLVSSRDDVALATPPSTLSKSSSGVEVAVNTGSPATRTRRTSMSIGGQSQDCNVQ